MVVMSCDAISAGSAPNFFTSIGSTAAIIFESIMVKIRLTETMAAIIVLPGLKIIILAKFTRAKHTPTKRLTLNSFQSTLNISLGSISLRAMPLITKVAV